MGSFGIHRRTVRGEIRIPIFNKSSLAIRSSPRGKVATYQTGEGQRVNQNAQDSGHQQHNCTPTRESGESPLLPRNCEMTARTRAASSQTPPGGINLSRERHHIHITSTTALLRRFPVVLRFCSCFWTIVQLGFRLCSRSNPCGDSRRQYFVNSPEQSQPATNTNG